MFRAIADLPSGSLWSLLGIAVVAAAVLGLVTNAVLKDRGFGVVPNGLLMLVGFVAGVWARYALFGRL